MPISKFRSINCALVALVFAGNAMLASPAHAISIKVTGEIVGKGITFDGQSNVGLFSRKGPVTGKLSDGTPCKGNAKVNATFKTGSGRISCGGISADFTFTLSSRTPPKGRGGGTTNKGDKISFRFGD